MATFNKEDKHWLLGATSTQRALTSYEEALVFTTFDTETDEDERLAEKRKKELKFLKKVCLYKIILFIPEAFLSFIFFGKQALKDRKEETFLYYKFLRNKIKYEVFAKKIKTLERKMYE